MFLLITQHPFNWKCYAKNMRKYISNLLFVTGALTMLVLGLIFDYSLLAFVLSSLQYIAALIVHGKTKEGGT